MNRTHRIDPLLVLRGCAVVAILLYHMQYPGVNIPLLWGYDFRWITISNSYAFVWIFFILSGYLIGKGFFTHRYSLNQTGLLRYLGKRILRIVPYYYCIVLINIFLFRLWLASDRWEVLIKVFTFTASDQVVRNGIDYLWMISTEMQWYVLAPLAYFLLVFLLKINKKRVLMGIILSALVIGGGFFLRQRAFFDNYPIEPWQYLLNIYTPIIYNLDFFLFGFLLNLFVYRSAEGTDKSSRFPQKLVMALAGCGVVALYFLGSYLSSRLFVAHAQYVYYQGILLPILTMFICGFYIYAAERGAYTTSHALTQNRNQSFWKRIHPMYLLQWIGLISYQLYLVHIPIMKTLRLHCNLPYAYGCTIEQFVQRFVTLLGLSLLFAVVFRSIVQMALFRIYNPNKLKRY